MATFTVALANGVTASPGTGFWNRISWSSGWSADDWWTINYAAVRGSFQLGAQTIEGALAYASALSPSFVMTLSDRIYACVGPTLMFSAVDGPTGFNPQDVGASFIKMSNRYANPEDLVALASYQGRLAVFSRTTTQIWTMDPNPDLFTLNQVMQNLGTYAPLSVQSLGDLDVLFLADSGIRSLRVRDSSLNAIVVDVGSPVDLEVKDLLLDPNVDTSLACSVVEPTANRYWIALDDTIYVLSYFPSAKITAWSNYDATYKDENLNDVTFVPEKFLVFNGHVWCRSTDGRIIVYSDQYDETIASFELPWLDGKKPSIMKVAKGVDAATTGTWAIDASFDYKNDNPEFVPVITAANIGTFDDGVYPLSGTGTHVKIRGQSAPTPDPALLGMIVFHYEEGNNR